MGGRGPQTALSVTGRAVCQRRAWGRWYEEGRGRVGPGELTWETNSLGSWCSDGKASAFNAGTPRFDPRVGKIPWRKENGNPLQYSCLESSMDGGASLVGYSPWTHKERTPLHFRSKNGDACWELGTLSSSWAAS